MGLSDVDKQLSVYQLDIVVVDKEKKRALWIYLADDKWWQQQEKDRGKLQKYQGLTEDGGLKTSLINVLTRPLGHVKCTDVTELQPHLCYLLSLDLSQDPRAITAYFGLMVTLKCFCEEDSVTFFSQYHHLSFI